MALQSNALTTLAMAKAYLKIPVLETAKDPMLDLFINAASDLLETETGRRLKSQAQVDLHHGRGTNILLARDYPVTSITEVRVDQSGLFTDAGTIQTLAQFAIADQSNSVIWLGGRRFPDGYNNVRLSLVAGFVVVPADLELACLWIVSWHDKLRDGGDVGRPQKGKGDESATILQDSPDHVKAAILRHKRTECAGLDSPVPNE